MSQSSPLFLNPQVFLALVLIVFGYAIGPNSRFRKVNLLIGSIMFYFYFAGAAQLLIILGITSATFYVAKLKSKGAFIIGVGINLLAIIFSKILLYINSASFEGLRVLVPLGISFFVFEYVHYLVEVRRGNLLAEKNVLNFFLFGLFFPTVISGPIKRYENFNMQIKTLSKIATSNIFLSAKLISLGFLYKFGADQFANLQHWGHYYNAYTGLLNGSMFLVAISLRIFLDFAGYSYMAIGIARIFGIDIPKNFDAPYLSTSIIDFWSRWHISLSSWVRDYLYIPLGGSRVQFQRQIANLLIAMSIIGLWHGLGTKFLIWGLLQGIGLSVNHAFRRALQGRNIRKGINSIVHTKVIIKWFSTYLFVCISWVFFFYEPSEALRILHAIFMSGKLATYLNLWISI
jgi:alginate O-acetyltransferase complex protein AlgI